MECRGYNGTIAAKGDHLIITHSGFAARSAGLVVNQPRRIPLQAVSGVTLKGASPMTNGWLTLGLGGVPPAQLSAKTASSNPDTVMFRRKSKDEFKALHDWLVTVVEHNQAEGIDPSTVKFDAAAPTRLERMQAKASGARDINQAVADRRQLEANSLAYLSEVVYLGGYFPGVELVPGKAYDVRFLADQLVILPLRGVQAIGQLNYSDVEKVEIGGPGLVRSGGGFIGGGLGATGAAEGMAIASVLNAATTRTKIKTVVQVQAASAELFFLHARTEPEVLRIELSRAIGAVREAQSVQANTSQLGDSPDSTSLVSELAKLASMLESGLLTREEFDRLKARLIADP